MWKFIDIGVDTVYYQTCFFFYDRFTFKYQSTDILYNFGIYNTYQNVCVQNFLIAEDDQTIEFY